jgi:uncharacterized protein (TIGR03083 family)
MSEIADRYRDLSGRFTDIVMAVPEGRWDLPSPCEGWSARGVFTHVVDSEQRFLARFDLVGETATGPWDTWPIVRAAMQNALDDPATAGHRYDSVFGPTTVERTVDGFMNLDLIVHGWDIARATGLTEFETLPESQLEVRFHALQQMGDAIRTRRLRPADRGRRGRRPPDPVPRLPRKAALIDVRST